MRWSVSDHRAAEARGGGWMRVGAGKRVAVGMIAAGMGRPRMMLAAADYGPTTHGVAPLLSLAAEKLLFWKSGEVCFFETNDSCSCRWRARRVKWNSGRKSKRFHLRRRARRRHRGLESWREGTNAMTEAGCGAVRGGRRFSRKALTKHHSWKVAAACGGRRGGSVWRA